MAAVSPGLPVWDPDVWAAIWEEGVWASDADPEDPDIGASDPGIAAFQSTFLFTQSVSNGG